MATVSELFKHAVCFGGAPTCMLSLHALAAAALGPSACSLPLHRLPAPAGPATPCRCPAAAVYRLWRVGAWFQPCQWWDQPCRKRIYEELARGHVNTWHLTGFHRMVGSWIPGEALERLRLRLLRSALAPASCMACVCFAPCSAQLEGIPALRRAPSAFCCRPILPPLTCLTIRAGKEDGIGILNVTAEICGTADHVRGNGLPGGWVAPKPKVGRRARRRLGEGGGAALDGGDA